MQRRSRRAGAAAPTAAASQPPPSPPPAAPHHEPHLQWRKVLYMQQPHGDAYTSERFLEELVVNATVPQRDYGTVVWSTLVVDQQLSTVAAVGSASYHLYQGTISARQLLLADVLLAVLGALLYLVSSIWLSAKAAALAAAAGPYAAQPLSASTSPAGKVASPAKSPGPAAQCTCGSPSPSTQPQSHNQQQTARTTKTTTITTSSSRSACPLHNPAAAAPIVSWQGVLDGLASVATMSVATALLSPLLGTLTETVSSDSIIACACLLLLAHLYLHDYHFTAGLTAHLSGSLALGCAVCGSVLIASRLGSAEAVYAQLLLSLELYILGPYCRRQVAAAAAAAHLALTLAMVAATASLLARQSVLLTSSYCCALLFITFVCPMWLVRIHKFKAQINGPWDEAVPKIQKTISSVTEH